MWGWGLDDRGQLGFGTSGEGQIYEFKNTPIQFGIESDWSYIATGNAQTFGIKTNGTLWASGYNSLGQLGTGYPIGPGIAVYTPTQVGTDSDWAKVSSSYMHTIACKTNNTIWSWGYNHYGQLGLGITDDFRVTSSQIGIDSDWFMGDAGGVGWNDDVDAFTIALKTNGTLWSCGGPGIWGDLGIGYLDIFYTKIQNVLLPINTDLDWSEIAAGTYHAVALKTNKTIWVWGRNQFGQLGCGDTVNRYVPTRQGAPPAPSSLVARTISSSQINLTWNDNSNTEVYFKIERRTTGTGELWTQIATVEANSTSYADFISLLPDRSYYYRVRAYTPVFGNSDYSNEASASLQLWITIDAGSGYSIAVESGGTIWAWGQNQSGQLGLGDSVIRKNPVQIDNATDWFMASAGEKHTIALKTNPGGTVRTLRAWGKNDYGQLGLGDQGINRLTPAQIGIDLDWSDISNGQSHTIALKINRTVWAWGRNDNGQLGLGFTDSYKTTPVQIGIDSDWAHIVAGSGYSLSIKTNGTIWSWGLNTYGQLGLSDQGINRLTSTQIGTDSGWVEISAGGSHSLGRKSDGAIYSWGKNNNGQLGLDDTINRCTPTQIGTDYCWIEISAGDSHSLGRQLDNTIYAWGANWEGQLGLGYTLINDRTLPTQIGLDADWVQISAGGSHSLGRKTDNTIYAWGFNNDSQLGVNSDSDSVWFPALIVNEDFSVAPSGLTATTVSQTQIDLTWVDNTNNELGFRIERKTGVTGIWETIIILGENTNSYSDTTVTPGNTYYYRIMAYNAFSNSEYSGESIGIPAPFQSPSGLTAVLIPFSQVNLSWDDNSANELGFKIERRNSSGGLWNQIGTVGAGVTSYADFASFSPDWVYHYRIRAYNEFTNSDYSNEVYAYLFTSGTWSAVNCGGGHSIACRTNKTLWSWGYNGTGQLGHGDITNRYNPVQVNADSDWLVGAGGGYHTIVLKTNPDQNPGTIWAWGKNDSGQLGLGDSGSGKDRTTPTKIGTDSDWFAVACGNLHTIALKTNGSLWAWGDHYFGQLGIGKELAWDVVEQRYMMKLVDKCTTTQVGIATNWANIAVGASHSIARKTNGTIWAWGSNEDGQLGLASASKIDIPNQIGMASDWSIIACGNEYTLAIKTDSIIWAWGKNDSGQLGLGDTINRNTPAQIGTESDWFIVAGGGNHTLVIKTNKTIWSWGSNASGQLGLGDSGIDKNRNTPTQIGTESDWSLIDCGSSYSLALKTNPAGGGTLWSWGNNANGQLGRNYGGRLIPLPVSDNNPSDDPSSFIITATSSTQINLSWIDNCSVEDGFEIWRSDDGITYSLLTTVSSNVISYSDTVTPGGTYYYCVKAVNAFDESDYSEVVASWPAAPSGLNLMVISPTEISLTWSDNSNNEDGFQIERRITSTWSTTFTVGANTTSYSDTSVIPTTPPDTYYYRIKAYHAFADSGYSNEVWPSLSTPSALTITSIASNQIDLAWTDNNTQEFGFIIERKITDTQYSLLATVGSDAVSYSDTTANPSYPNPYYYRIKAYNAFVESDYAGPVAPIPSAPVSLNITLIATNNINLAWIDYNIQETGFKIERKTGADGSYAQIATTSADVISYSDTAISPGNNYYYRVRSYNDFAESDCSNLVTLYPLAPVNLQIISVSASEITISWTDQSDSEVGFKIERSWGNQWGYTQIGTVDANVITYTDTTVIPGNTYYYRVKAFNAFTESIPSNQVSPSLSSPYSLIITSTSPTGIEISWSYAHTNEVGFKIERRQGDINDYAQIGTTPFGNTSYSDTVSASATPYYYRVRAYNDFVNSLYSNSVSTPTVIIIAPSNLVATGVATSQIDLAWSDNSDNESGFKIERRNSLGALWEQIVSIGSPTLSYSDTNLSSEERGYYYRVRAYTDGVIDGSAYSNEAYMAVSGTWVSITAGDNHNIALKANGTLWSWGYNNQGQLGVGDLTNRNTPSQIGSNSDWLKVVAGDSHSVAIKSNGAIWSWGYNNFGQLGDGTTTRRYTPVPIGTQSDWSSISGGTYYSCALKTNGTLWSWGSNSQGRLGIGFSGGSRSTPTQVGTLSDWINIKTGNTHSIALKTNGTIWSWGNNFFGQLGLGDYGIDTERNVPTRIEPDSDWVKSGAGANHSMAIKTNGILWSWGYNNQGQLGLGYTSGATNVANPTQTGTDSDWFIVTGGNTHTLAVKTNPITGVTIWACGENNYGQLGIGISGSGTNRLSPVQIGTDTNWELVAANYNSSIALKNNGTLWSWGYNNYGQLGLGNTVNRSSPVPVDGNNSSDAPSSLTATIVSLTQINLLWNNNSTIEEGFKIERKTSSTDYALIATLGPDATTYADTVISSAMPYYYRVRSYNAYSNSAYSNEVSATPLIAPSNLVATVTSSSSISFSWKDNSTDESGFKIERSVSTNTYYALLATVGPNINTYIDNGLTLNNTYYYRVQAYSNDLGANYTNEVNGVPIVLPPSNLTATIVSSNEINLAWQDNSPDETGFKIERKINGADTWAELTTVGANVITYTDNVTVSPLTYYYYRIRAFVGSDNSAYSNQFITANSGNWFKIAGGNSHAIGLKANSTLWAWGNNGNGQLGLGYLTSRNTLTQIGIESNWIMVNTGSYHSLGGKSDGTLWAWGYNTFGRLGDGTTTQRTTPRQIWTDSDWSIAMGGGYHTLAIKTNKTLWAWGRNNLGQLGDGTGSQRSTPELIGAQSDWSSVVAGDSHSVARKNNGSIWSWGNNNYGQLGLGITNSSIASSSQIGIAYYWSNIATGSYHTIACRTNGTLWSWGYNNYGQLGLGDGVNRNTPTQIGTDSDWSNICGGGAFTLALKTNKTIWSWGVNTSGQLGLGDGVNRNTPTQIGTQTDWTAISAGDSCGFALKTSGLLWAWGANSNGQLGLGDTIDRNVPTLIGE
jgi:alpha-tubulin suppressor-like RCC1 family protein